MLKQVATTAALALGIFVAVIVALDASHILRWLISTAGDWDTLDGWFADQILLVLAASIGASVAVTVAITLTVRKSLKTNWRQI